MKTKMNNNGATLPPSLNNSRNGGPLTVDSALPSPTAPGNDGVAPPLPATASSAGNGKNGVAHTVSKPVLLHSIGTEICTAHTATKAVGAELLVHAAKCGLLLVAAKQVVGHGDFETWCESRHFEFSKVTRCKYMRVAERLCMEAKSKPDLLLKVSVEGNGAPVSFRFDEARLKEALIEVCAGRKLSDLYVRWDIVKSLPAPVNRGNGNPRGQTTGRVTTFDRWIEIMELVPTFFSHLLPQGQSQLVAKLQSLLATLQGMQANPDANADSEKGEN